MPAVPQEALLPHEKYCDRCGGEGFVSGYSSSFATGPTQVDCPDDCANGVVAVDRRDATNRLPDDAPLRLVFEEVRRLIHELEIRTDELRAANTRVGELAEQNRKMRERLMRYVREADLGMKRRAS